MACFTAASALLIIAIFLFTRGLCKRRRKAVFFISGLLFSISGNERNTLVSAIDNVSPSSRFNDDGRRDVVRVDHHGRIGENRSRLSGDEMFLWLFVSLRRLLVRSARINRRLDCLLVHLSFSSSRS